MFFTKRTVSILSEGALLAAGVVLSAPASAAAAGGSVADLALPLFNFAVYVAIGFYLYRRFVRPQLKSRSLGIREQLKASQVSLQRVEGELSHLRARLTEIAEEKRELIAAYEAEGDALARAILVRGEESARALAEDHRRRIEQEFKNATSAVRNLAIDKALAAVRADLNRELTDSKDAALRKSVVQAL